MYRRSRDPNLQTKTNTQTTSNRTTRQSSEFNISVPRPKTELLKRAPCYRGATLWNALPNDLKEVETAEAFKKALKGYLSKENKQGTVNPSQSQ